MIFLTLLLFWWSNGCWQFDLWFLCLFYIQFEHLKIHGSHTIEAWVGEFWALEIFDLYFASVWDEWSCAVIWTFLGFSGGLDVKESACSAQDLGSIPVSGRSPGEGNGNPLQYSCLEYPMDGGTWPATVHGATKSQTWLSNFSLDILWHCSSLGLEWKLIFSSPVATAEFSKSWHIEGSTLTASSFKIWIAQLEFHHLH